MYREEYEKLTIKELIDAFNGCEGYDIITREEYETKAKEDIDAGNYYAATEKLRELDYNYDYFMFDKKCNQYLGIDETGARKIIEENGFIDIEEEPTEEDIYWEYLERQAEAKREEELFGRD